MTIRERHTSPDGLLTLLIDETDGDWTIGFDGYHWHTHGDILASPDHEGSPEKATRRFLQEILSDRQTIVISRVNGEIRHVWVTDDVDELRQLDEGKYLDEGESIEKRLWSRRVISE